MTETQRGRLSSRERVREKHEGSRRPLTRLSSLEICAGAGGQALGLEQAGFQHDAVVEIDHAACATLRANRPNWNVIESDIRSISGDAFKGIDLLAGGVPCPPFSVAGKRMGKDDERDLFPVALDLIAAADPKAVILENVPGLSTTRFASYRDSIRERLDRMGYSVFWQRLESCNYGVPQLRPRFVLIALKKSRADRFVWPRIRANPPTVGEVLGDLMASRGWRGASAWAAQANSIAPTIVGGSKLHGGPDLGPTRAKQAWAALRVDAHGVADLPPGEDFPVDGAPKLTVRMAARIQGFPDSWRIEGRKTSAYRQVGNAFPPPVACAIGLAVHRAIVGDPDVQTVDDSALPILRNA